MNTPIISVCDTFGQGRPTSDVTQVRMECLKLASNDQIPMRLAIGVADLMANWVLYGTLPAQGGQ